mgnify:FL=1
MPFTPADYLRNNDYFKIPFMIKTERLRIQPLTYDQLVKYAQLDGSLEKELNLNKTSRSISPDLKEALEQTILPAVADSNKNYLFSTLWTIISKSENKMVGDLCFYGEPNIGGEIEIGYGTYAEFEGKGYMTEAVRGIIGWAARQPNVKSIIAHSDHSNTASCKVLEKNNFVRVGDTDALITFKLNLK